MFNKPTIKNVVPVEPYKNSTVTSTSPSKYTIEPVAPIINKTTISEEQIEEMAALLDNIIQDALVICEEDCCKEQAMKIDVNAISRSIVKTITKDLLLPKFDVLEYQKQIRELEKKLKAAKNYAESNYKEPKDGYGKSYWKNDGNKK